VDLSQQPEAGAYITVSALLQWQPPEAIQIFYHRRYDESRILTPNEIYGRGAGVGRGLGVEVGLGIAVGVGLGVAVAVGVGVGVA
jgi:hypothetical protein